MTMWAESFRKVYPSVQVQVEGKGSGTAPPALIAGTAQIGPMSREMKADELDAFEKKFGYPPTQVRVAIDALAVYVQKDNLSRRRRSRRSTPSSRSRVAAAARCRPRPGATSREGRAGHSADPAVRPQLRVGTYGYFKEVALCGGDYRDTVKEQPGSAASCKA